MEINWKTILNVLIALVAFKFIDTLFLDNVANKVKNKMGGTE